MVAAISRRIAHSNVRCGTGGRLSGLTADGGAAGVAWQDMHGRGQQCRDALA